MLRWNAKLNLTSLKRLDEIVARHYCESLILASHLPSGPLRIADVGSGAGFPGIPVAVALPACSVTLIESHQRKAVFLREATRSFSNVRVLARRAEDVSEHFDWVISRAVSYDGLRPFLSRLAPDAALLTGPTPPPADLGFDWRDPIPVQGGFLRLSRPRR
jgi:16S rRNA (guanine(527)-N(7))-methyltransferase RsmG